MDILIRNVSEDDVARIDEKAQRLGLSRAEFLRRQIESEARRDTAPMVVADLDRLATLGRDLLDASVMDEAWS